jgi:hypothetical protein
MTEEIKKDKKKKVIKTVAKRGEKKPTKQVEFFAAHCSGSSLQLLPYQFSVRSLVQVAPLPK